MPHACRLSFFSLLLPILVGLAGCGVAKDDKKVQPIFDPSPLSDAKNVGNIYFDAALSQKERGAFTTALDYLDQTDVLNADQKLLDLMKIPRADRRTVRAWIEARAQYIVTDKTDENKLGVISEHYSYENPGRWPPEISNANETKGKIVMANIGVIFYLTGKKKGQLVGVNADGIGQLPLSSPRSGVLIIGEGFFMVPPEETAVAKIFHLTTLIHESRHSDGNKETTGFFHVKCVDGDFAGEVACDHNSNGPYEIEALAIKALYKTCNECTTRGRRMVEALYYDAAGREINDNTITAWDDAPEGHR